MKDHSVTIQHSSNLSRRKPFASSLLCLVNSAVVLQLIQAITAKQQNTAAQQRAQCSTSLWSVHSKLLFFP